MSEVEGKWEVIEESGKPKLVMVVLILKLYLLALVIFNEYHPPPLWRQLILQRQAMAYLMGGTSGLGFGLMI